MKVSDVISKLKVMLADNTEEVVETKVKEKMAEAELVDGTQVYTEGELEPGAILFVRAGEGVSEDPFAPAGIHETKDGLIITVGENGEITSIEEKSAEAELEVKDEEMAKDEDPKKEEMMDMEELLKAIVEMLKPYTEGMQEAKEKIEVLENRFNKIADEPAATRIKNNFKADLSDKSKAEARFERLIELRKSGAKLR